MYQKISRERKIRKIRKNRHNRRKEGKMRETSEWKMHTGLLTPKHIKKKARKERENISQDRKKKRGNQ